MTDEQLLQLQQKQISDRAKQLLAGKAAPNWNTIVFDDPMMQMPETQKKFKELYNQQRQKEECVIITSMHSSVVSDSARKKYFEKLDAVEKSFPQNYTQRLVDGEMFIKHPISGDWLLKHTIQHIGDSETYTRHRRLDHLPHYQAALDLAVKEMEHNFTKLDYAVGGIAMQFIRNDNGDKVLINSVQEPLPALDLTEDEKEIIIYQADSHFSLNTKARGGFFRGLYHVQRPEFWCWDNNGVIEILNPYTVEDSSVDYNMAKYRLRKSDELLIKVLDSGNSNVALLLGKPGTGKTFFTDCYAKRTGAEYIYTLCHDGTNSEDLFYSINVGKAVLREAGSSDEIYQAGILLRAVRASLKHKVVVCIDEIDKASKRTENLFLDFAETYRVPFLGTQEQGVKENITLFFTSNGYRPHSEAFLRRCYRHHFDFLPRAVEVSLIGGTFATAIVDALTAIREGGASSPSVKEGMLFAHNLQFAANVKDVECLMYAHLCKEPEDMEILQKGNFANKFITKVF